MSQPMAGERLLPIGEVCHRVGLSRATIYRRMAARAFPMSLVLGPTCVRWRLSDIDAWIDALPVTAAAPSEDPEPVAVHPSKYQPTPVQ
jgi:prophage regulatory protein